MNNNTTNTMHKQQHITNQQPHNNTRPTNRKRNRKEREPREKKPSETHPLTAHHKQQKHESEFQIQKGPPIGVVHPSTCGLRGPRCNSSQVRALVMRSLTQKKSRFARTRGLAYVFDLGNLPRNRIQRIAGPCCLSLLFPPRRNLTLAMEHF